MSILFVLWCNLDFWKLGGWGWLYETESSRKWNKFTLRSAYYIYLIWTYYVLYDQILTIVVLSTGIVYALIFYICILVLFYLQVNGVNLAEIQESEVTLTNLHSSNGPDFVLDLKFSCTSTTAGNNFNLNYNHIIWLHVFP